MSGRYHAKMKLKSLDTVNFSNKDNSNRRKSARIFANEIWDLIFGSWGGGGGIVKFYGILSGEVYRQFR